MIDTEEKKKDEQVKENVQKQENTDEVNEINQNNTKKPKKNVVRRTINITTKLICLVIVVLAIVLIVRVVRYQKYDVFGYRFYLIMSGSMEPTINVGDAVITKEISDPQIGDVIAFEVSNSTTVHRIVKTYTEENNKLYQTKGDNNNAEDRTLLNKEQIKGKVVFKLSKVGDAILFLQKNIVIILILIVGIAIIITLIRRLM